MFADISLLVQASVYRDGGSISPALRNAIEGIVVQKLKAHASSADGLHDFALQAHGGRVASALTSSQTGYWSHKDDPGVAIEDDGRVGCHAVPILVILLT